MADHPVDERLGPREVLKAGLCIGCGSCAEPPGSMVWDPHGQLRPEGDDTSAMLRTEHFARTCPFSPHAANETELADIHFPGAPYGDPRIGRFEAAYVGHAVEGGYRERGSSGGMANWTAAALLRAGLVDGVAHVVPQSGHQLPRFAYRISRTVEAMQEGAKSRYYPVHMAEILSEIRRVPGRYALVGIPCFIKAVQLLRSQDALMRERIAFTLGLFCGHMKSARFADSLAWQMAVHPDEVERLDYRLKDPHRPANWYRAALQLKGGREAAQDWWHLADGDWGAGFFQHNACNYCDDVVAETADIAFGDAWVEPYASDGRGTNVVILRSPEMVALIDAARADGGLDLAPVDGDFIVRTQEAGLRQRREGLAYRLHLYRGALPLRKRVAAASIAVGWRRRLVYRTRAAIARWSHRVARLAILLRAPRLYIMWARSALAFYQGLTYSRGRWGKAFDWLARVFRR